MLLRLFRINPFLQHGERKTINGFIHRLLTLADGNTGTDAGLQGYSDNYLKMDIYNNIWGLTYRILLNYNNKWYFLLKSCLHIHVRRSTDCSFLYRTTALLVSLKQLWKITLCLERKDEGCLFCHVYSALCIAKLGQLG